MTSNVANLNSLLLAVDFGGTNPRAQFFSSDAQTKVGDELSLRRTDDVGETLAQICSNGRLKYAQPISGIGIGIAGIVKNGVNKSSNVKQVISQAEIWGKTGIATKVANDFQLYGYAAGNMSFTKELAGGNLIPVTQCEKHADKYKTIAIPGAGTGLGLNFVLNADTDAFVVGCSEGGNTSVSYTEGFKELYNWVMNDLECTRMPREGLTSGRGLNNIAKYGLAHLDNFWDITAPGFAMRDSLDMGQSDSAYLEHLTQLAQSHNKGKYTSQADLAPLLSTRKDDDPFANAVMRTFAYTLGLFCGNIKTMFMADALVIAGGVVPKNIEFIQNSTDFQTGMHQNWAPVLVEELKQTPVFAFKHYDTSLYGAAKLARRVSLNSV